MSLAPRSDLADTVIMLRYFEVQGEVRRAVSVVKKRTGRHENTLREFSIDDSGLRIGRPLELSGSASSKISMASLGKDQPCEVAVSPSSSSVSERVM